MHAVPLRLSLVLLLAAACTAREAAPADSAATAATAAAAPAPAGATASAGDADASGGSDATPARPTGDGSALPSGSSTVRIDSTRPRRPVTDFPVVRGLYVNRWAAQSPARMRSLIAIADSTEINAFVIDLKDEFGLNYVPTDPAVARNAGNAGTIPHLTALLDTLHAHGILPIARLVTFKDSVAARANPSHVIRQPNGEPWRDKTGLTWVNPYDREIWNYNFRVAEDAIALGFTEIQFDYIRFPEPYASLPTQVFPGADSLKKPQALGAFLKQACGRINASGARCTADIFGLVTTVPGALEIGQEWEVVSPVTDVLLPMVYPSHYPRGAFGVASPNAEPYRIVHAAIARAHERDRALGITAPEHVRPWLQAFTLGKPPYEAQQVREQKRAVYDAGYDGWVLWHPGSKYGPFLPALEKTLVSRKRASPADATP